MTRVVYPIVSSLSFIIRFWLCYITIEAVPIFSNEAVGWVLGQVLSIYTIFRLICYPIVGVIAGIIEVESPTAKSIMYFLLYLPLIGIYWLVLLFLTHIVGVLPI